MHDHSKDRSIRWIVSVHRKLMENIPIRKLTDTGIDVKNDFSAVRVGVAIS